MLFLFELVCYVVIDIALELIFGRPHVLLWVALLALLSAGVYLLLSI